MTLNELINVVSMPTYDKSLKYFVMPLKTDYVMTVRIVSHFFRGFYDLILHAYTVMCV